MGGDKTQFDKNVELIMAAKNGDIKALNDLAELNLSLVTSIAKNFMNRGYEFEDLFQIGSIGLTKAIKNFNPEFNLRFSTYAVPMIMGEIRRFIRDDGPIKLGRKVKVLARQIRYANEELIKKTGRQPSAEELAEHLKVDLDEVKNALGAVNPVMSLYEVIHKDKGNGNSEILLIDKLSEEGDDGLDIVDNIVLIEAFNKLDGKTSEVMKLRYLHDKTQTQVAKMLNISQAQVSRFETKALKFIKNYMEDEEIMPRHKKGEPNKYGLDVVDLLQHCKKYGPNRQSQIYYAEQTGIPLSTVSYYVYHNNMNTIAKPPFEPLPTKTQSPVLDINKETTVGVVEQKVPEIFAGAAQWRSIQYSEKNEKPVIDTVPKPAVVIVDEVKVQKENISDVPTPKSEDDRRKEALEFAKNFQNTPNADKSSEQEILAQEFKNVTDGLPETLEIEIPRKVEELPKSDMQPAMKNPYTRKKRRIKISALEGEVFSYTMDKDSITIRGIDGSLTIDKAKLRDFFDEIRELRDIIMDEELDEVWEE
jgi:RNA polymerase sporulation-specific sigma factor